MLSWSGELSSSVFVSFDAMEQSCWTQSLMTDATSCDTLYFTSELSAGYDAGRDVV